jgi:phage gp36-like protein
MPYATQSDMISEFGEREVIALTDRDNTGLLDAALLDDRLEKASGEIDSYLVGRYSIPLSAVSPLITTYCCDIARYRLSGAQVAEVEAVRNRYKDAIRFLEAVRDGKIDLGAAVAAATDSATQDLAYVTSGSGVFSRPVRR